MDENTPTPSYEELEEALDNGFWPEISDPKDKELLQAAENGNWDRINSLLSEGINVDKILAHRPFGGITVLVATSMYGHLECVQKLVELGAGLNEDDRYMTIYQSALKYAAIGGHLECFRFLTEARLFRRLNNNGLYDDIIAASKRGDFECALKFLDDKMYGDLPDNWIGNNLISLFIIHGCPPSCIQTLIDQGVSRNGYDYNGFTPLMSAVLSENIECVQLLLQLSVNLPLVSVDDTTYFFEDGSVDPNIAIKDKVYGLSAVMFAACLKNVHCLSVMIQSLAGMTGTMHTKINITNSLGYSPVMLAAFFGNIESISLLLESKASLYYSRYKLNNAFAWAILSRNFDCLDLLLKDTRYKRWTVGADDVRPYLKNSTSMKVFLKHFDKEPSLDNVDNIGLNQLLLFASRHEGSLGAICLLLEEGADINWNYGQFCDLNHDKIPRGATPLMVSCSEGLLEVMTLLIKHGADLDVQDHLGDSAIMYAARSDIDSVKCVQLLLDAGVKTDIRNFERQTPFVFSCVHGFDEIAHILILHGVDVNVEAVGRKTALMYATLKNHMTCLQLLVDHGAIVDSRDAFGKTALIIAGERGHGKAMELLISNGADVNVQDDDGKTAAIYAAQQNHSECIQQLMCANADVDILDKDGGSVLSASISGDGSCMEMLWHSGKLFSDNGKLKSLHKSAITRPGTKFKFNTKLILLTLQFRMCEWDSCSDYYNLPLFVFAAVQAGANPGNIRYGNKEMSPLLLAFHKKDTATISYLLANLYFFPEDYRLLRSGNFISNGMRILDQLTLKPLSLQAWSFLTISQAISLGSHATERSHSVDLLPLPEKMKRKLKFQSRVSKMCFSQWKVFETHQCGDFLFKTNVSFTETKDNPCAGWCSSYCVRFTQDTDQLTAITEVV